MKSLTAFNFQPLSLCIWWFLSSANSPISSSTILDKNLVGGGGLGDEGMMGGFLELRLWSWQVDYLLLPNILTQN